MSKSKGDKPGLGSKATRDMLESIILTKLHGDGFIKVDEDAKTAVLDCRRGVISDRYEESSYDDIRDIMERTAKGLKLAGYSVRVDYLEGV